MAITTYSELKTSIANWLNRDDLTTQIPDFISLAEENASLLVRHWRMENRATAAKIKWLIVAQPQEILLGVRNFML